MKQKYNSIIFLVFGLFFLCSCNEKSTEPDHIEKLTGLKRVEHEYFITDLKYNSTDNFLKKNVYEEFNLSYCYIHLDVYEKLMSLVPVLEEKKFKLVFYDCYRPIEVQRLMWDLLPDTRYVANPQRGSLHNRGIAIDVGLADLAGNYLPMPTKFDFFGPESWHSYEPKTEAEKLGQINKNILKELCESIGLKPLKTEWWHYHFPNPKSYSIIYLDKEGTEKQ